MCRMCHRLCEMVHARVEYSGVEDVGDDDISDADEASGQQKGSKRGNMSLHFSMFGEAKHSKAEESLIDHPGDPIRTITNLFLGFCSFFLWVRECVDKPTTLEPGLGMKSLDGGLSDI